MIYYPAINLPSGPGRDALLKILYDRGFGPCCITPDKEIVFCWSAGVGNGIHGAMLSEISSVYDNVVLVNSPRHFLSFLDRYNLNPKTDAIF